MRLKTRLKRLEDLHRRQRGDPHFLSICRYPWNIPATERERWLREEVRCPCGRVGCPALRIGALVPEKCRTVAEWETLIAADNPEQRQRDCEAWYAEFKSTLPEEPPGERDW